MTPIWAHWRDTPDRYAAICDFVSFRVWGESRDFGKGTALGVFDHGVMVAGVIYHNFDRRSGVIEMSSAADTPRWMPRPILWAMFDYPFNQMECQSVVLRVDEGNTRLDRILKAYGFTRYDIPRLRGRDRAEALFVLCDDAWRGNGFHREHEAVMADERNQ